MMKGQAHWLLLSTKCRLTMTEVFGMRMQVSGLLRRQIRGDEVNIANDGRMEDSYEMPRPSKLKLRPPHSLVLEALATLNPEVRRMFSGFAVYVGDRLFMMRIGL
jgi:hypothetical protein